MRFQFTTVACLWLLLAVNVVSAQSKSDSCHVYVVDVEATRQFREKTDLNALMRKPKREQEAILNAAGLGKTFGEFATKVAEEELTTRTFPFPNAKQIITASVFYTDESLVSAGNSDSMVVAISVGAKAFDDAISAPDAAITEVTYDQNTDAVRAKRNIVVNGREYLIGLECRCKKDRATEKK